MIWAKNQDLTPRFSAEDLPSQERKQRLSELRYNVNDYVNDDDMYRRISRFKWSAPENRGHYKTIKGVRWFDDFIMERLVL